MSRDGWLSWSTWKFRAESSCGPVIRETPEEALARRVKYAAAHPLPVAK